MARSGGPRRRGGSTSPSRPGTRSNAAGGLRAAGQGPEPGRGRPGRTAPGRPEGSLAYAHDHRRGSISGAGAEGGMEYYDLGRHSRPVTTSSPEAQTWFDRGLVWTYGFNHDEAVYCFEQAL